MRCARCGLILSLLFLVSFSAVSQSSPFADVPPFDLGKTYQVPGATLEALRLAYVASETSFAAYKKTMEAEVSRLRLEAGAWSVAALMLGAAAAGFAIAWAVK
jgi:hypothetical protein